MFNRNVMGTEIVLFEALTYYLPLKKLWSINVLFLIQNHEQILRRGLGSTQFKAGHLTHDPLVPIPVGSGA